MLDNFNLHSTIIFLCAVIFVVLCLQGLKMVAAKMTDQAQQRAVNIFMSHTGEAPSFVLAYARSALCAYDDRDNLLTFGKDNVIRVLSLDDVSGWYAGSVVEQPFDNLIDADYDSKSNWVLIYDQDARLIVKIGVLHKSDLETAISYLSRLFTNKKMVEPGALKLFKP